MKNNLALIICFFAIISCSNTASEKAATANVIQNAATEKDTYLSANINGITWQANQEIQSYTMDKTIMLGGENDAWVIGINIPDNVTAGQTINTDASIAKKMKGSSNILYNAETAVLKISSKTATGMEGSFSFTGIHSNGKEKVIVDNGKFKTELKKM